MRWLESEALDSAGMAYRVQPTAFFGEHAIFEASSAFSARYGVSSPLYASSPRALASLATSLQMLELPFDKVADTCHASHAAVRIHEQKESTTDPSAAHSNVQAEPARPLCLVTGTASRSPRSPWFARASCCITSASLNRDIHYAAGIAATAYCTRNCPVMANALPPAMASVVNEGSRCTELHRPHRVLRVALHTAAVCPV